MAEETSTGMGGMAWKGLNSFLGVAGLASALGIGIPALVKANNAEDQNTPNGNRPVNVDNNVIYLRNKIYTDEKTANLDKQIALVQQAQQYQQQINEIQLASLRGWVGSNFMRGQLYLPAASVNPLPMQRFNAWEEPIFPVVEKSQTSGTSTTNTTNG